MMLIKLFAILLSSIGYYAAAINRDEVAVRATETRENNTRWHKYEFYKVAIFALLSGFLYASISFESLFVICLIGTLRIVYFNPMIAKRISNVSFFYLGSGSWEKKFHGKEKLYYFANLTIFILCLLTLILKAA